MATGSRDVRRKPLFYDWLIEQINSRRYTGVTWLNEEHLTFRVPWKHLNMHNVIEEDFAIFKAWAIESQKYNEAENDRAKWKTNFHGALKSIKVYGQRVFKEVQSFSSHPTDPHKVFRIYQDGALRSATEGLSAAPGPAHLGPNAHAEGRGQNNVQNYSQNSSAQLDQELTRFVQAISIKDAATGEAQLLASASRASYVTGNQPEENSFYDTMTRMSCDLPLACKPIHADFICPPALHQLESSTTQNLQGQNYLAIQPPCTVEHMPKNSSGNIPFTQAGQLAENWTNCTRNTPDTAIMEAPCRKRVRSYDDRSQSEQAAHNPAANGISQGEGASRVTRGLNSAMVRQGPIQNDQAVLAVDERGTPDDMCCLQLNIHYRRKHVLHLQLNHSRYLFSYNKGKSIHGPHAPVCFPSPAHLPDQKQVQYTTMVLEAIEEGLLLEVNKDQKKIYATWLGSSHYKVHWATAGQLASLASIPPPEFLQKNIATEIFNFQTFLEELEDYFHGRRRSPDFTVYLCFGQNFSVKKPKEEKLVLVERMIMLCMDEVAAFLKVFFYNSFRPIVFISCNTTAHLQNDVAGTLVPQYCVYWYEFVQREGASSLNSLITSLQIPSLLHLIEEVSVRGW